jgi:hypothetical protein
LQIYRLIIKRMHKINILTITALILLNFANAGIISLGICYTGCNILWVACCSAAGGVAGVTTGGAGVPAAILACNAA